MLRVVRFVFLILLFGIVCSKDKAAKAKVKTETSKTAKPDAKKKTNNGGFRLPSSFENIKSKILSCMAKPVEDGSPITTKKAPFAIVQGVRGERLLPEDFDKASSLMRCYARKHGGLHFQNVFNNDFHTEMNFYTARWKTLRDRFWGTADWVIGSDGDVVPIGWHKNIMNWLNGISADIVIHIRENYELHAAMIAFRTSSPFARCFLDEWIHLGKTKGQINSDNGDLLQLVLGVTNQTLMEKCVQQRLPGNRYSTHFVPCFSEFYDIYEANKLKFPGQSYTKGGLPIKIYYPLQGFLRSYEGPHEAHTQFGQCLSTDVFGHGYKKIGHFFSNDDLYACTNNALAMNSFLPACYDKTRYQNETETLELAKKECYWHYSGCLQDGHNICKEMKNCEDRITLKKDNRFG